ncbi:MAG: hypothetical protein WC663_02690 [Patescibacteria group bacterium]|jgi:hypothetical protein
MSKFRRAFIIAGILLFSQTTYAANTCPNSQVSAWTEKGSVCVTANLTGSVQIFAPENFLIYINKVKVSGIQYNRGKAYFKVYLMPGKYDIYVGTNSNNYRHETIQIHASKTESVTFASPKLMYNAPNVSYPEINPEKIVQKWDLVDAALKGMDCVYKESWKKTLQEAAIALSKEEPTSCLDIAGIDDVNDFVDLATPEVRAAGSQDAFHTIRAQGRASLIMYRFEMDFNVPPKRLREGKIVIRGEKGIRGVRITLVKGCLSQAVNSNPVVNVPDSVMDVWRAGDDVARKRKHWEAIYGARLVFGAGYSTYLDNVLQTHQIEFPTDFNSILVIPGMRLGTSDYDNFYPSAMFSLGYDLVYLKPRIGGIVTGHISEREIERSLFAGIVFPLPVENLTLGSQYEYGNFGQNGFLSIGFDL